MKKYFYVVFAALILTACQNEDSKKDGLYKAVESYVNSTESDIYDFEEICRYSERINKLNRDTDIYMLQENIKNVVNQRLAVVAHTYLINNVKDNSYTENITLSINDFINNNNLIYNKKALLEIEGKDLKVCPNPQYSDLYLTQEEIDYVNKMYYSTIPEHLETIKNMESRKFDGVRCYFACKFRRKMSDRIIKKQYVVYNNKDDYEFYELKYDYDLLRTYVREISNTNLKDPYVVSLNKIKYDWSNDIYRKLIRRLDIDIHEGAWIQGF